MSNRIVPVKAQRKAPLALQIRTPGCAIDHVLAELPAPFVGQRGSIQILEDFPIGSALVITFKEGSARGNHRHEEDDHNCYLASGRLEFHYRPAGSDQAPEALVLGSSQMVHSPPMIEHTMRFLEDSVFYVLPN